MARDRRKPYRRGLKPSKTIRALMENAIPAVRPRDSQPHWTGRRARVYRLTATLGESLEWRPDYLADILGSRSPENTLYFVDTGFVTTQIDERVWDAILRRKVVITPQIWGELGPWLESPKANKQLRDLIRDSRAGRTANIEHLSIDKTLIDHAYDYYLALLSSRKKLWREVADDFGAAKGREPTEEELLRRLQTRAGDYFDIAKKGWEDREKPNLFADEELVVSAVLTAVLRGVEVVILTRDNDIQRQLTEMFGTLSGHYDSMLYADYLDRHRAEYGDLLIPTELPGEDPRGPLVTSSKEMAGFTFSQSELMSSRPDSFLPAVVNCMLFGGNDSQRRLSILSACVETRMRELLKLKTLAHRPNTDKFGDFNCHLAGAMIPESLTFILAKDVFRDLDGVKVTGADYVNATGARVKSMHFSY
ncbi:hypothetical protein [Paludisphaera rhizosphaerae]|uniref:hypothetical protein n=1 Tax=Paludisphaera rhizosphaerae TaxID=2711216 RepID=UPI0013ED3FC8|nr:hypothetical protein [Paludisphaera rhizosphaerae]